MPSTAVWIKADGAQKYKAVARRLREAGRRDLQRKLTRAIRREGEPALQAVRAAWLTVDVQSSKSGTARPDTSTGLRQRVARATHIQARQNGISIIVNGKRVDPQYPSLVFYLNGMPRVRGWRHKVFGHNVWVVQYGQEVIPKVPQAFAPRWRAGIVRAMEETVAEIEG